MLFPRPQRIGSSNLNIATWMENCEIDVAIEDDGFAGRMQAQFEEDLRGAAVALCFPRVLAWPIACSRCGQRSA